MKATRKHREASLELVHCFTSFLIIHAIFIFVSSNTLCLRYPAWICSCRYVRYRHVTSVRQGHSDLVRNIPVPSGTQ